ncbi:MAG: hypothetical protein ACRDKE_10895 [Solirubrobacterales bacterium]
MTRLGKTFTFSRALLLVTIVAATAAAFALPSAAEAAAVPYLVDTAPNDYRRSLLTVDGDELTAISMTLYVWSCGGGGSTPTGHSFVLSLPAGPVPITNGAFQVQGTASAAASEVGSADFSLSGQLSEDRTSMTGTATLTNASNPAISGCTETFSLLALPEAGAASNDRGPAQDTNFDSQFLTFDYYGSDVTRLIVQSNFHCGTTWQSATLDASKYGITSIPTTPSGDFSLHRLIFDSYDHVLILDLTGHIDGMSANGTISISEPPGFHSVGNAPCSGQYAWTATKSTPALTPSPQPIPVPPAKPTGPYATYEWNAVRVPRGTGFKYYFYVTNLKCRNSATEIRIKVRGRTIKLSCRKRAGWASRSLPAGGTYGTSVQAVRIRRHKVVKRGETIRAFAVMPDADDDWQPLSGSLGRPPG